jgi:hypothetical protein
MVTDWNPLTVCRAKEGRATSSYQPLLPHRRRGSRSLCDRTGICPDCTRPPCPPLQAYFYDTCYLRFAASDYDANDLDVFQHLTNNSVSKYYEGPRKEGEAPGVSGVLEIAGYAQAVACGLRRGSY